MTKRDLKFILAASIAGVIASCTKQHVVLSDMTTDQHIVQVTAEGFLQNYSVHIVLRDNSGDVVYQQEIIGNIDFPGDMKDYVAYAHRRGKAVEIGVRDIAYVQGLDPRFGAHVLMRRYSEPDYNRLVSTLR